MTVDRIRDSNGNTITDYPSFREDGAAVLLAIVDGSASGPAGAHARYYHRDRNRIELFRKDADVDEYDRLGQQQLGPDEPIGAYVREIQTAAVDADLSPFAKAMARAEQLADTGAITRPQAEVYALRAEQGVLREDAAKMLGKSKSTLDSLLLTAKDKIDRADRLARETVDTIQFEGESAPLYDAAELSESDLLTTAEFEDLVGGSLIAGGDGNVVLTTDDGSYYVVASSTDGGSTEIHGVVPVAEANDAFDLVS
ncbi:hypothetical protein [Halopiger djelfimassiliensis]|uniref:hypothetical protein n=1 Tax=Halopiger djelfimassiliensis TaxID=1293047 RepID=UPI0006777D79|nr:hypothetical protein [Halopiger djelfimassiliensis]